MTTVIIEPYMEDYIARIKKASVACTFDDAQSIVSVALLIAAIWYENKLYKLTSDQLKRAGEMNETM